MHDACSALQVLKVPPAETAEQQHVDDKVASDGSKVVSRATSFLPPLVDIKQQVRGDMKQRVCEGMQQQVHVDMKQQCTWGHAAASAWEGNYLPAPLWSVRGSLLWHIPVCCMSGMQVDTCLTHTHTCK